MKINVTIQSTEGGYSEEVSINDGTPFIDLLSVDNVISLLKTIYDMLPDTYQKEVLRRILEDAL